MEIKDRFDLQEQVIPRLEAIGRLIIQHNYYIHNVGANPTDEKVADFLALSLFDISDSLFTYSEKELNNENRK